MLPVFIDTEINNDRIESGRKSQTFHGNVFVDDLIRILVRGGYESMASACDQVIMVLDYSTEELPLHVNDGGIVEATTVWRLRHGI